MLLLILGIITGDLKILITFAFFASTGANFHVKYEAQSGKARIPE